MSLLTQSETVRPPAGELEALRHKWGWFLALGVALVVVGLMAMGASFITTLATVVVFGTFLVVGGAVHVVEAFWARGWGGFLLSLAGGVLYLVVGALMIEHPLRAAAGLTLMLAAAFLVGGVLRIVVSLTQRFAGWGWVLLNGVVTLLLGMMIWRQWPESSLWVIGLFVGIDLVFGGWAWVMFALAIRALGEQWRSTLATDPERGL